MTSIIENFHFMSELMYAENAIRSGYVASSRKWWPHKSLEGGTPTLGYGHKLTPLEHSSGKIAIGAHSVDWKKGLTQKQILDIFIQDVLLSESYVRRHWNSYYGDRMGYDYLPDKYRGILVDVQFNTGNIADNFKWKWPKLAQAILDRKDHVVRQEAIRYYTNPSGQKVALTGRVQRIADVLGLKNQT